MNIRDILLIDLIKSTVARRKARKAAVVAHWAAYWAANPRPPVVIQPRPVKVGRGQRMCAACGSVGRPKIKTRSFYAKKRSFSATSWIGSSLTCGLLGERSKVGENRTAYCRNCRASSIG